MKIIDCFLTENETIDPYSCSISLTDKFIFPDRTNESVGGTIGYRDGSLTDEKIRSVDDLKEIAEEERENFAQSIKDSINPLRYDVDCIDQSEGYKYKSIFSDSGKYVCPAPDTDDKVIIDLLSALSVLFDDLKITYSITEKNSGSIANSLRILSHFLNVDFSDIDDDQEIDSKMMKRTRQLLDRIYKADEAEKMSMLRSLH